MTDTELAALFDWDPQEPCQRTAHDTGASGCVPALRGTHIILSTHGVRGSDCAPQQVVVCIGHCDWIRVHSNDSVACPTCKVAGPLRRFLQIVGPIRGSDWTGTAEKTTL